jgi:hypothetical protein
MTRADQVAWGLGGAGLVLSALGWVLEPRHFHAGWLAATVLFSGWPLGSIALILIHTLTGGRWGEALRPALVMGVCTLPLLLLALLPVLAGLPAIYEWARPEAHLKNGFYLNVPFFALRGVVYLVVWFGLGGLVLRGGGLGRVAPAGLFLLAVTTSFAATDTTMSLDPHFTSTIYGMIAATGMVLLALSVAVLAGADALGEAERGVLGKLLLALVILWAYLDFMQLLIVWQSDLAREAPWYIARSRGLWNWVRAVIGLCHFALPVVVLLSPSMQRSRRVVGGVAGLLIAMEILRTWWTVLPSLDLPIGWIDVACMAALGGLAVGLARWAARRPGVVGRASHV